ncbi:F0F1 ATP synthase subunit gamma [Atribacter laminatus]|uniref:ATP synthase gamma chain n=1 Tax=Atribacter laminatus TaxID=2847778 RepID=A0A7T1AMW6_ATRLM|nr:FoF1 ATP synthase subunit gamma [Atribacter laminatus]QPM68854.1 ATP synthase gamma chain [Atribacter laminatus]
MAKIQTIKNQIDLIKQIQHVTRAMKTISAVRWRTGKKILENAKTFSNSLLRLNEIVHLHYREELITPHPPRGFALIGIFSDKGLVGGFNVTLAHKMKAFMEDQEHEGNKPHLIILGTQGINQFHKNPYEVLLTHSLPVQQTPHYQDVREILYTVRSFHEQQIFSHLYIAHNQYLSVNEYRPIIQRVIPIPMQGINLPTEIQADLRLRTDILSTTPTLVERLTFEYVASQLYVFLIESFLSEQATRLKIMDAATSHSEDMIHSLQVAYQKRRQEKITQELNEVTSASQVLGTI